MSKLFCMAAALSVLTLSGCASNRAPLLIQPIMHSKQSPATSSGYVAGMFSRTWDSSRTSLGLGIVNTTSAEEYVIPFGVDRMLPTDVVDEFGMIQLPPGEYRIAYWINYSIKDKEPITKTAIPSDSKPGLPFTLAPGEVVFIGGYVARMERTNSHKTWAVHHQRLTLRSVQKALTNGYPAFTTQPLSCPSCLE